MGVKAVNTLFHWPILRSRSPVTRPCVPLLLPTPARASQSCERWVFIIHCSTADGTMFGKLSDSLLGVNFLSNYYVIFEPQANFMGLATKNVGASAATVSVLTGSG